MAFSFLCQRGQHPLLRPPTSALPLCPQVSAAYGMNIKHYQSDRNAGELMVGDWSVVYCDDWLCTFGFWFVFQWVSEAPRSILLVSKHFRHDRNAKTRHKRVFDR